MVQPVFYILLAVSSNSRFAFVTFRYIQRPLEGTIEPFSVRKPVNERSYSLKASSAGDHSGLGSDAQCAARALVSHRANTYPHAVHLASHLEVALIKRPLARGAPSCCTRPTARWRRCKLADHVANSLRLRTRVTGSQCCSRNCSFLLAAFFQHTYLIAHFVIKSLPP